MLWSLENPQVSVENGFMLEVETVLFGTALDHISIYLCAFDDMARTGIAGKNNHFVLHKVEALAPNGETHLIFNQPDNFWGNVNQAIFTAVDWIDARSALAAYSCLTLQFPTLLRLQDNNRLLNSTPEFTTLFSRLLDRINSLCCFYAGIAPLTVDEKYALQEVAARIVTLSSDLHWQDWSRYSSRQKVWMKFGGLTGSIVYQGEFKALLPYLLLGEQPAKLRI